MNIRKGRELGNETMQELVKEVTLKIITTMFQFGCVSVRDSTMQVILYSAGADEFAVWK